MAVPVSRPGRAPVIGVSLKMYFDPERSAAWAKRVAAIAAGHPDVRDGGLRLFVLPSLPALPVVLEELRGTGIEVGAQDLFWEDRGPYTGGVSGADLAAVGCTLAEIGHAERRRHFGETDATINRKVAAAVRNGLTPVLCVGERVRGSAADASAECLAQLESALADLPPLTGNASLIVAYEPEWAIGVQEAAAPAHVDAVTADLREVLDRAAWPGGTSVIYGGSAGPGLLPQLGSAVDGLFLGRFAHDPDALGAILDDALARR
ncbi:MAG: triosephosphate isomerase [Microbacteriaceae bacterium]|nr:triosephosphate isomerase [Microbacteriaceae bacterium]